MNSSLRTTAALATVFLVSACPKDGGGGSGAGGGSGGGVKRCEVDLKASGFFAQAGTGASAKKIDGDAMLIGGPGATGRKGDVLLKNDKIRVVIEQPGRSVGPILSGGSIIDADLVRADGAAGHDAFGRMNLLYALGRLSSVTDVEVLSDGSSGGPAVVASTGHDVQHDLLNIKSLLANQAGLVVDFVVDPTKAVPLRTTTYFVLSPGESRVRMLTAFCNDGTSNAVAPMVELMDVGAFELFNVGGCSNSLGAIGSGTGGSTSCLMEPSKWFGSQGDGVAYGVRSQSLADLTKPVGANAVLGYGGVVGAFIEGENVTGVLSWTDPEARNRPGTFVIKGGGQKSYLRDFVVAEDLAGINGALLKVDGVATGQLDVSAKLADGSPAAGGRVSVLDSTGKMITLVAANAAGEGKATLAPGTYKISGSLQGYLIGAEVSVTVTAGQTTPATVQLLQARTLDVTVKDPSGAGMPAKVTVLCVNGPCPFSRDSYAQHLLLDAPAAGSAEIGYVPVNGQLKLTLPPAEYDVVVSRGPEYSIWPETWPISAERVDLRTADGTVNAVLAQVVDTTGWMSADLHVHAVNSSDSSVANAVRASNFLAEGVDVLLSTDHEVITDFAPTVKALGAEAFIATMIGEEVTSFTHGHFNTFPLVPNPNLPYGGPFDHAGGEDGPTLRMPQLFSGIKAAHAGAVVQLNHPRGGAGVLTQLKVDTATLASHAIPADFNMAAASDATTNDTRLFGDGFDLIEAANGPNPNFTVLNDWMTFLSRGTVRTSTGVSDSHYSYSDTGGYARTWAKIGVDTPADFKSALYADAMRAHHATISNGPFVRVTARKADSAGVPTGPAVEIGDTVSLNAAAGETIELTVDVQAPAWVQFDRIEIYTHTTGREAERGESNSTWPESRVLDFHSPALLTVEPVMIGGKPYSRVHQVEKFIVKPTKDTWYVAMVRSTGGRTMWPLHTGKPASWTNAILVDADGSGKYDDFPLKLTQPLSLPKPVTPKVAHVPSEEEFARAVRLLLNHTHE